VCDLSSRRPPTLTEKTPAWPPRPGRRSVLARMRHRPAIDTLANERTSDTNSQRGRPGRAESGGARHAEYGRSRDAARPGLSTAPGHQKDCGAWMVDETKPNILVIWGDDIGISNLSCYSHGLMGYRTRNIDRLAAEGTMFTDCYGEQSCTAGRSAFITGQNVFRTGLSKVGMPGADTGLHASDPTIAEMDTPGVVRAVRRAARPGRVWKSTHSSSSRPQSVWRRPSAQLDSRR
jgi:Sulfatase